ncbi:MAG TPA: dephospho-CoA kinase, partial [Gemmataceae bacterium]|nr:dephospho-CoA kinase [Gemmataceae bacterium]
VTSPKTKNYNCVAWSFGHTTTWWWPVPIHPDIVWPAGAPREVTVRAFREAFLIKGYAECLTESAETGFEKIALFAAPDGVPTHVARQLESGHWTSKLGRAEDIEHTLRDLVGEIYGSVVLVFKRAIPARVGEKLVLALIGGIGSGKSAVAAEFARHGAAVISGDQLGHEALQQPDIRAKVIAHFGPTIIESNGEINRRKLGAIVFADLAKLRELEKIVFPWIEKGMRDQIAAAQQNPAIRLIVVDAAVMLEAGWNKFCDKIVYIDAPREQRLARLSQQRGWTEKEVESRAQAQLPLDVKVTKADASIDNSGTPDALAPQITQLLNRWRIPVAFDGVISDNV